MCDRNAHDRPLPPIRERIRIGWNMIFNSGLPWNRTVSSCSTNIWFKLTRLRGCCGNFSQPGC